jgi:hypothetical protein
VAVAVVDQLQAVVLWTAHQVAQVVAVVKTVLYWAQVAQAQLDRVMLVDRVALAQHLDLVVAVVRLQ